MKRAPAALKRSYFYMQEQDMRRLEDAVQRNGEAQSKFVRAAIAEKMDRDEVVGKLNEAREQLGVGVHELRAEVTRLGRDLLDGHSQSLELVRDLIDRSAARNEQANHQFLRDLAGVLERGSDGLEGR